MTVICFFGLGFGFFGQAPKDDGKLIGKIINETRCVFLKRTIINYLYTLESYITCNYDH